MMNSYRSRVATVGLFALAVVYGGSSALADCSNTEVTAVFVVGDIYPGSTQILETLSVYETGVATYPPESELIAAILDIEYCYNYIPSGTLEPFRKYYCPPSDIGAVALVDERTGQVPFVGSVVWAGTGHVVTPAESSHQWAYLDSEPAAEPATLGVFDSEFFLFMEQEILVANVFDELRQTDVLHSFAECGQYDAVMFVYLPTVGMTDPNNAKAVVVVRGLCGPPWNDEQVAVDNRSWGAVKGLFR